MPMSFQKYFKIKDNYCCCYLGNSPEYVLFLKLLKPQIEKELAGLNFWIACRDEFTYLLDDEPNTLSLTELSNRKNDFSYVRELRNNNKSHSILNLMNESKLPIRPIQEKIIENKSKLCLVCPESIEPTKSLNEHQLKTILNNVSSSGYSSIVLGSDIHYSLDIKIRPKNKDKFNYVENVGCIVGVENEYLVLGAVKGIRTKLINSGNGSVLFKSLFPFVEVIESVQSPKKL